MKITQLNVFWLILAIIAATAPAIGVHAANKQARPNFVFIYADDWRGDCLGVVQKEQGQKARFPWLETPNLDKLAGSSTRFRNSFVVNSLCSPGRACVLTSTYNHLNGILGNGRPLPAGTITFGNRLQDAGYNTGYCGKFHMDSQRERPGFDYVASFIGQGRYNDCPIIFNGKEIPTKGWVDDVSTDYAIKFINKQSKEKPFFVWLGFKSPHGPRGGPNLPERVRDLYADKEARDVPSLDTPAIFNQNPDAAAGVNPRGDGRRHEGTRAYMSHITAIDGCIGRVLDALKESGHADNTIIMIASDNGYYLGEHKLSDKRSAYEESLRVPLLIHLPASLAKGGTTSDDMALNIDYAPTILDFAGAKPLPETQGRSLRPILTGKTPDDWRKAFLYEYFKEPGFGSPTIVALRTETEKLITYPGNDEWTEVYDIASDPYELKNLVNDSSRLKKLRAQLDAASAAVKFRMPELPKERERPKRGQRNRNRNAA
jgi:arylsulfatase A-like enzyme